jgi:hypothetical protein
MSKRTYNVLVAIDSTEDRATVTVDGVPYRYPWHWSDNLRTMARVAVFEHYNVSDVVGIECHARGVYRVTAEGF